MDLLLSAYEAAVIQHDELLASQKKLAEAEAKKTETKDLGEKISALEKQVVESETARDALMCEMDRNVPGYGLAKHKGYGTVAHRAAVKWLGYSPVHRKTFAIK